MQSAAPVYGDFLTGRVQPQDVALLPAQQRAAAIANLSAQATVAAVQIIDDPLSRLVAAAVLFQGGRASPGLITLAVDTASAQGWRRPLLAWLHVQAVLAERLQRRIGVVSPLP